MNERIAEIARILADAGAPPSRIAPAATAIAAGGTVRDAIDALEARTAAPLEPLAELLVAEAVRASLRAKVAVPRG